ncbi:SDR family oxidoreductase [Actinomadura sp. CNU-125]|uniref:SDR family oxidoreductase n=1 Tax=Actinomadura sp. CNU-125 TaxID=1904961 RepID=UPI0021CCD4B1|nr:SDR family oxidoreductase [Actinomadura sp. CNU-125]
MVMVASEAYRLADPLDVERLAEPGAYGKPGSLRVYGRSKLLNILFARELARRMEGSGVVVNAMCPGPVATELLREQWGLGRLGTVMSHTPVVRTPEQGARQALRLAVDEEFEAKSGGFYGSVPGSGPSRDERLARDVWDRSAHLVGLR